MTPNTETPEEALHRYLDDVFALPADQEQRILQLGEVVKATHEAARLAMLAYVRAEMETQVLSAEERADIERLFAGVPGDPTQASLYGVTARRKAENDIYHAHDYVRHVATRGRIGEAA